MLEPTDASHIDSSEIDAKTHLQPMAFTDILDAMFTLYGKHFWLFLGIAAIDLFLRLGLKLPSAILRTHAESMDIRAITHVLIFAAFAFCVTSVVHLLVGGGLIFASAQVYLGQPTTPGAALMQGVRRFWSYFGGSVLWFLTVGVVAITLIGIPLAIYLAILWSLYSIPIIVEESRAANGLRRSRTLVKGTWWRVFGILFTIHLLLFMIGFILHNALELIFPLTESAPEEGILEMIVWTLLGPSLESLHSTALLSYVIRSFIELGITTLLMPIAFIGSTLLYFDLRIRKEGFNHVQAEPTPPVVIENVTPADQG